MDPVNVMAKFEARSFTCSWDNSGYFNKNLAALDTPTLLFSTIFNGLLFGWTLWMYRPNLKAGALPVPEIIASTLKTLDSRRIRRSVQGRWFWYQSKARMRLPIIPSQLPCTV